MSIEQELNEDQITEYNLTFDKVMNAFEIIKNNKIIIPCLDEKRFEIHRNEIAILN